MNVQSQLHRYADLLRSRPDGFDRVPGLPAWLRMRVQGSYEVFYAPFDHVNRHAELVLVGITPGRSQALEALHAASAELRRGAGLADAAAKAKVVASFAGPTRRNLVSMLDAIGVAEALDLPTTERLWSTHSHLVHFTSVLRYPVLAKGGNYTGAGITKSRFLQEEIEAWFGHECKALPQALFVPLGDAALSACQWSIERGLLRPEQIVPGVPHPSPSNIESIVYFLGRKEREAMSAKRNPDKIEAGRARAKAAVAEWSARRRAAANLPPG